jgi:cytochrome c peroxidase
MNTRTWQPLFRTLGPAALALSLWSSACGGGASQPMLSCPKGLKTVWLVEPQAGTPGVGECLAPLPEVDVDNGLLKPFPTMVRPAGSLNTPERIELGRLLFFDPLLSGDNQISCAHCHHPDRGFADGRDFSIGIRGQRTGRSAPTVWNAAFNKEQFWDGRAQTLEDQAKGPIQSPVEMDQKPDELVAEIKRVPAYVEQFDRAFSGSAGSAVTFDNIATAIAAFERTVVSAASPFDRFAAGDTTALTPSARNGLKLFRSVSTRCFECHGFPNLANQDYKVIGVPDLKDPTKIDADLGRGAIIKDPGYDRAFKVPTLRNVEKTAPYMHNGIFHTLEEVLDFYAKGGGHMLGVPNLDDKIRKFDLSESDRADMVAFMKSLTDESLTPEVPAQVPSGLPVLRKFQ